MKRLTRGRTLSALVAPRRARRAGAGAVAGRSARGGGAGHRAAARGRRSGSAAPVSGDPLVERRRVRRARRRRVRRVPRLHRRRGRAARSIPTSAERSTTACPSTGSRTSSWARASRRRPSSSSEPSESDGVDHSTETSYPFYPIPDEAITQAHWVEGGAPGNVDLRADEDRHVLILDRDARVLYELYNVWWDGSTWQAYSGRGLRPDVERPAAGRLDVGRRGGARDPAGARPLRRGLRERRDPPRLPDDGAPHEGLRLTRRRTRPASRTRRRSRWARACA